MLDKAVQKISKTSEQISSKLQQDAVVRKSAIKKNERESLSSQGKQTNDQTVKKKTVDFMPSPQESSRNTEQMISVKTKDMHLK